MKARHLMVLMLLMGGVELPIRPPKQRHPDEPEPEPEPETDPPSTAQPVVDEETGA